MVRPCDEDDKGARSQNNVRCGHTRERSRGRPNLGRKTACKRDMTAEGLEEDNITHRASRRKTLTISAIHDDVTSHGKRRIRLSLFLFIDEGTSDLDRLPKMTVLEI